jgi:hypothetical protein
MTKPFYARFLKSVPGKINGKRRQMRNKYKSAADKRGFRGLNLKIKSAKSAFIRG